MLTFIWTAFLSDPEYFVLGALAGAEVVTRLTPTKKDDGFIKRIGGLVDKIFSVFPNRIK